MKKYKLFCQKNLIYEKEENRIEVVINIFEKKNKRRIIKLNKSIGKIKNKSFDKTMKYFYYIKKYPILMMVKIIIIKELN